MNPAMSIKRSPADFAVEEILKPDLALLARPDGPFALYRLKKETLATPEAVGRIARALGAGPGALAYAGL